MQPYSNTKLKTFEQCPLQFRYRYLDRVRSDLESIEAYTGKRVHESLEWLFEQIRTGQLPSLQALLADYEQGWRDGWHPLVYVVKREFGPDAYRRRGARCLENFYQGNHPFDADETIALEAEVSFLLGDDILVRGYIDRVARGPAGQLLIHDYKTSSYLPQRQELLSDLQLAIYQLGAAERWPGMGEPQLVWHFLSFGRKVTVELGDALTERRQELARQVAVVERAVAAGEEMPARVSRLCEWCSYQPICPARDGSPERAAGLVLGRADRPARRDRRRPAAPLAGERAAGSVAPDPAIAHRTAAPGDTDETDPSDQLTLF